MSLNKMALACKVTGIMLPITFSCIEEEMK